MTAKLFEILFTIAAASAGLIAAWKWYLASAVQIDLGYVYPGCPQAATYRRGGIDLPRGHASGDPEITRINEIAATWEAINESSRLNRAAALWTAASTASAALSAIAGAFV
jgi:hypothetical protein